MAFQARPKQINLATMDGSARDAAGRGRKKGLLSLYMHAVPASILAWSYFSH